MSRADSVSTCHVDRIDGELSRRAVRAGAAGLMQLNPFNAKETRVDELRPTTEVFKSTAAQPDEAFKVRASHSALPQCVRMAPTPRVCTAVALCVVGQVHHGRSRVGR